MLDVQFRVPLRPFPFVLLVGVFFRARSDVVLCPVSCLHLVTRHVSGWVGAFLGHPSGLRVAASLFGGK